MLDWLGEMSRLFPVSVCETIQVHAVDEYGMAGILRDPAALAALQPNADLLRRLRTEMQRALSGARRRRSSAARRAADNLDFRATVRDNLKHWNVERQILVAERLRFHSRAKRRFPWTVILCMDQSGSMAMSVIHAAVMAAVLSSLPAVTVRVMMFDTSVVDLSDQAGDPVDVLMAVQLGGGSQIGPGAGLASSAT